MILNKIEKIKIQNLSVLLGILFFLTFLSIVKVFHISRTDNYCTVTHKTILSHPKSLKSAFDFYNQGNYYFETGNCEKAITSYTKSIELDPDIPQTYNNRAYAYMRLQEYAKALPDLDKAIQLRPDYTEALMNRADIHNYYYAIDRKKALKDYDAILAIDTNHNPSVCGHRILAENNGWNLKTVFQILQHWSRMDRMWCR